MPQKVYKTFWCTTKKWENKNFFLECTEWEELRCWGQLSLLNWIRVLILSLLLKVAPRKLGPWFVLWSFFPLRLLCISINLQYCHAWNTLCLIWAGTPSCYLELMDKLPKWICRTVGPSLAASLERLAHHWNEACLSLLYSYCFVRCSSELAELVPLPYSRGRHTCYSDRLNSFCHNL